MTSSVHPIPRSRAIIAALAAIVALPATATAVNGPAPGAVSAQTVKLPSAPGSVRGLADDAAVSGFTGQVQYAVPIEVPKAPGGFAPSLALGYDGDLGNGPLGVGWSLAQPGIRRSLRLGVPAYDASDELELVGLPVTGQLVALPGGDYRVEGQANRYTGRAVTGGFELVDPDGLIYRLGITAAGRKASGAQVAFWYLEELQDLTGQIVHYQYNQDRGETYLASITWGPALSTGPAFRADLVYEARGDAVVSYRTGFRVESAQRLAQIRISSFGQAQRIVALSYDDGFALTRLHSVQVTSGDGVDALPTTTFSYAAAQAGTLTQIPDVAGWGLNLQGTSLFDVDGDGAMDLLRLTASGHSYRRNLGGQFAAPQVVPGATGAALASVRLLDLTGDSGAEMVWQQGSQWSVFQLTGADPQHRSWTSLGSWSGAAGVALAGVAVADLDGDCRMDVISASGSSLQVRFGGDAGLAAPVSVPAIDPARSFIAPGNAATLFPDINGDGLADVVYLAASQMYLYLGKGDGHFEKYRDVAYPWTGSVTTAQIRLGDLNRDGLLDVALVRSGDVAWYRGRAGGGFDATPVLLPRPAGTDASVVVALADANGNGSEDVVWSSDAGMWILDLAGATSAGMLTAIDNGLGQTQQFSYTASTQLAFAAATAGAPWSTTLPVSIPVSVANQRSLASGEPSRTTRLTVRDGIYDTTERRFIGFQQSLQTVPGATTADDVVTLTRYHPGLGSDRALRGQVVFAQVQDGSGKVYQQTEHDVAAVVVAGLPDDPRLRRAIVNETRVHHLEGTATPIIVRTRFVHDAEGRVIEQDADGRIDVDGDEAITTRSYADADPALGVRDRVCQEAVLGADRVAVSQTRRLFGDDGQILPLCQAGKGWLRAEQGYLAGDDRWVDRHAATYDAHGNPLDVTDAGVTRRIAYDGYGQFAASETVSPDPGHDLTWTVEWNTTLGVPHRLVAPDGAITVAEYDGLGRLVSLASGDAPPHTYHRYHWSSPRPTIESFVFDGDPAALAALPATWTAGSSWRHSVAVHDSAGEPVYTATQLADARWIVDGARSRDARGRTIAITNAFYADGGDPTALAAPAGTPARTVAYDALDRPVVQTLADGSRKLLAYEALGLTVTRDLLAPVHARLDGLGRQIRTDRTIGGVLESLDAAYDAAGHLVSYSLQGGQVGHAFAYDTLGRLTSAVDPDIGARTMTYDDRGLLVHSSNATGQTIDYSYDGAGRLSAVTSDAGPIRFHYDQARAAGYDHTQTRLAWVEEPTGTVDLGYDDQGRQTAFHRSIVDGAAVIDASERSQLSPSGLLRSLSFDDGLAVPLGYDAAGRPVAIGDAWTLDDEDAAGYPLREHFGNGLVQSYERDAQGQATRVRVVRGAQPVYDVAVSYNAFAAITAVVDGDGAGLDHTASFGYDAGGRLTAATLGSAGPQQYQFAFGYDGLQNMIQRDVAGPTQLGVLAGSYRYAGSGPRQLTSVTGSDGTPLASFGYDAAGRQIAQGGRTLHYDALSQLTRIEGLSSGTGTVEHHYGFDGQRVLTRDAGGTPSYWLTPDLVQHDGVRDHYIRLGGRLVARITRGVAPGAAIVAGALGPAWSLGFAALLAGALASAVAAAPRGRRRRVGWAGAALAAVVLDGCTGGTGLGQREASLAWQTTRTLYFHPGVSPGPALVTDASGAVFEERRYEPFGGAVDAYRDDGGRAAVDFRREPFNSLNQPTDPDTLASYHGARWLGSDTARWLTPDPPVKTPDPKFLAEPWNLHPYQYVHQNPIAFWDPDGREEKKKMTIEVGNGGYTLLSREGSLVELPSFDAQGLPNGSMKLASYSVDVKLSLHKVEVGGMLQAFSVEGTAPDGTFARTELFTGTASETFDWDKKSITAEAKLSIIDETVGTRIKGVDASMSVHGGLDYKAHIGLDGVELQLGFVGFSIGRKAVEPSELSQHTRPQMQAEVDPPATEASCACSREPAFPH